VPPEICPAPSLTSRNRREPTARDPSAARPAALIPDPPEAIMHSTHTAKPEATLETVSAPSTIPPAPQSGVVLCGTPARSASPAATLRTSLVQSVAADEIDWLYENTDDETDPVCVQARATIESWLGELCPEHQLAIALHHDPMPWPEELPGHEEDSFALVLHLLCPSMTRDVRCYTPEQLALRARRRLEIRLEREGSRALHALIRHARWLFSDAVCEYAEVRGRVASVVPASSSSSSSSSFDLDA
jgi:hypothetical protein